MNLRQMAEEHALEHYPEGEESDLTKITGDMLRAVAAKHYLDGLRAGLEMGRDICDDNCGRDTKYYALEKIDLLLGTKAQP